MHHWFTNTTSLSFPPYTNTTSLSFPPYTYTTSLSFPWSARPSEPEEGLVTSLPDQVDYLENGDDPSPGYSSHSQNDRYTYHVTRHICHVTSCIRHVTSYICDHLIRYTTVILIFKDFSLPTSIPFPFAATSFRITNTIRFSRLKLNLIKIAA